jgi:hypothetical protein
MEIVKTSGARYFPQYGHPDVSGGIQSQRLRLVPGGARWLLAGRPFHSAPINPTGIDLPTTDHVRMSASEP